METEVTMDGRPPLLQPYFCQDFLVNVVDLLSWINNFEFEEQFLESQLLVSFAEAAVYLYSYLHGDLEGSRGDQLKYCDDDFEWNYAMVMIMMLWSLQLTLQLFFATGSFSLGYSSPSFSQSLWWVLRDIITLTLNTFIFIRTQKITWIPNRLSGTPSWLSKEKVIFWGELKIWQLMMNIEHVHWSVSFSLWNLSFREEIDGQVWERRPIKSPQFPKCPHQISTSGYKLSTTKS